ncbi:uncharacterized protein LOC18432456 [Amborella trichopoda]|uniref:Late embryogenesis abundant protein LEA-2 subgroup domain-containing protein n=1 Tax=Amborella trichopoda TaxID=13333 RepID=W1P372_AMBTC|nr:uncharacterized protein LOC18432456 [Amborella trichopoda]ERN04297.1 hypothetical protein AMTR_s00077p00180970 [Amborella trichopoda]|eukprot:XP_006842622.1 uncharacterized protein LOC18432456 [Amborella trichopoda]
MDSFSINKPNKLTSRNPRTKILWCSCICLSLLILIVLLILILAFTVFRARHTTTTVNSIRLAGLDVSLDIPRLRVSLNVSLDLNVSLKNPNKASFKYGNSTTMLYYRGGLVGEASIPSGEIFAGETEVMNLTLTILADRLLSDSYIYSDVVNGSLPLTTYTRISGRVTVMRLFKHHLVSYAYCDVSISIRDQKIENSSCRYRNKL